MAVLSNSLPCVKLIAEKVILSRFCTHAFTKTKGGLLTHVFATMNFSIYIFYFFYCFLIYSLYSFISSIDKYEKKYDTMC
jgi:hypothetical protein